MNQSDIFEFLNTWFAGTPAGDYNQDGILGSSDINSFLAGWFAGCPIVQQPQTFTIELDDVNGDFIADHASVDVYTNTPMYATARIHNGAIGSGGSLICTLAVPPVVPDAGEGTYRVAVLPVCDLDGDGHGELAVTSSVVPDSGNGGFSVMNVYSLTTCQSLATLIGVPSTPVAQFRTDMSRYLTSLSCMDEIASLIHAPGTGFRYARGSWCPGTTVGTKWNPEPPPGSWIPAAPTALPPDKKSAPGWWDNWQCVAIAGGKCKCTSSGKDDFVGTPPKQNDVRISCLCDSPANGCGVDPIIPPRPATPAVAQPPVLPAPAPTGLTCNCNKEWLY